MIGVLVMISLVIFFVMEFFMKKKEGFGSVIQIRAKGPHDTNLTINNSKYIYPTDYMGRYLYPYVYPINTRDIRGEFLWNMSTKRRPIYYYVRDHDGYYLWPYFYRHY